jgi:DNA-binding transcriptional regulator LsrR (DeoR family)
MIDTRPTELVLTARIARSYYLDGKSKSDIAQEIGISRFRVARLLDAALESGLVRIHIESPSGVDANLSVRLQQRFGLKHAVVIDSSDEDPPLLRERLGQVAADVLREIVDSCDVLGLAWARSLKGIGTAVGTFAPCPVVQLTGALSGPDGSDVLGLVRRVAQAGGGVPHVFYAPLVVPDAAIARTLRRQPDVSRAADMVNQVTVAVVGIGAWKPGLSTIYDIVEPTARDRATRLGVVGEISGAFIDNEGRGIATPLSKRIIGVNAEQLAKIPTVIAVAYGEEKAAAVRAAIRGGLVTGLITHTGLTQRLLELDDEFGGLAPKVYPAVVDNN